MPGTSEEGEQVLKAKASVMTGDKLDLLLWWMCILQ